MFILDLLTYELPLVNTNTTAATSAAGTVAAAAGARDV
jgi:hypothetical protein